MYVYSKYALHVIYSCEETDICVVYIRSYDWAVVVAVLLSVYHVTESYTNESCAGRTRMKVISHLIASGLLMSEFHLRNARV